MRLDLNSSPFSFLSDCEDSPEDKRENTDAKSHTHPRLMVCKSEAMVASRYGDTDKADVCAQKLDILAVHGGGPTILIREREEQKPVLFGRDGAGKLRVVCRVVDDNVGLRRFGRSSAVGRSRRRKVPASAHVCSPLPWFGRGIPSCFQGSARNRRRPGSRCRIQDTHVHNPTDQ